MRIDAWAYYARDHLEAELGKRASHRTAGHARTRYTFALAERFLRRGYRGRFPIGISQNATDTACGPADLGAPHEEKGCV